MHLHEEDVVRVAKDLVLVRRNIKTLKKRIANIQFELEATRAMKTKEVERYLELLRSMDRAASFHHPG